MFQAMHQPELSNGKQKDNAEREAKLQQTERFRSDHLSPLSFATLVAKMPRQVRAGDRPLVTVFIRQITRFNRKANETQTR